MANQMGPPPAPLHPNVAQKLLDLLSSDDDFRDLFQRDAQAALVQAGYVAPAGTAPSAAASLSGAECMQLSPEQTLASKEQIQRDRAKLESGLTLIQDFDHGTRFSAAD
jgi:putative modified peptide